MVTLLVMPECKRGDHAECSGGESAPPGEFGGVICDCPCHLPEDALWRWAERSRAPNDYRLYLQRFPNGAYAELARTRLAQF